jgi:hypothetical protein
MSFGRFLSAQFTAMSLMVVIAGASESAWAQQAAVSRVRGVIEKTLEGTLVVKTRDGRDIDIQFDDKTGVIGLRKIELSDLPPESFVGVAAVPGADGVQRAVSIHLFT